MRKYCAILASMLAWTGLAQIETPPQVLVLRGDAAPAEQSESVTRYFNKAVAALEELGVTARTASDLALSEEALQGADLVVLPWNPVVSDDVCVRLEAHVRNSGGKLMVCGAYPESDESRLQEILGVRLEGVWYADDAPADEAITGYAKVGEGIPGQPDFVRQASWQTALIAPDPADQGTVLARWRQKNGETSAHTAILKTAAGYALGHVWMNNSWDCDRLFAAILADACPDNAYIGGVLERLCARDDALDAVDRELMAQPSKPDERRLFWCHSAWGMEGKDWEASVRFLKENHFTDLMVNLAWGGTAFYESAVYPVNPEVATKGDALVACQAACRRYGVRLHVWLVTNLLYPELDEALVQQYEAAGRLQVGIDLTPYTRDGRWFCPTHPANRQAVTDLMVELAGKGVDGVHFDYIRYEGDQGCYCSRCRAQFEAYLGRAVDDWPSNAFIQLSRDWQGFRAERISSLVRDTAAAVRARRPSIEVSAAVLPDPQADGYGYGCAQDWPTWCREGWVDFVCPMDYYDTGDAFRAAIDSQRTLADPTKIYPGIGMSCWPEDDGLVRRFGEQVRHCRAAGYGGWTVFDLNAARLEEHLPKFASNFLASVASTVSAEPDAMGRRTLDLVCTASVKPRRVTLAYGDADAGTDAAAWPAHVELGTLPAGATHATYTLPADVGLRHFVTRIFLSTAYAPDETVPEEDPEFEAPPAQTLPRTFAAAIDYRRTTAELVFPAASVVRRLYVAWGDRDYGASTNGWPNVSVLGAVPAGTDGLESVTLPSAARMAKGVRFFLVDVYDAASYVQSGLTLHYDARENVGRGQHDAAAPRWRNLAPGGYDLSVTNGTFAADHLSIPKGTVVQMYFSSDILPRDRPKTVESVLWVDDGSVTESSTTFNYLVDVCHDAYLMTRGRSNTFACGIFVGAAGDGYIMRGTDLTRNSAAFLAEPETYSLVNETNACDSALYLNGEAYVAGTTNTAESVCYNARTFSHSAKIALGNTGNACALNLGTVRVYDRALTDAERTWNAQVDRVRYCGAPPPCAASAYRILPARRFHIVLR